MKRLILAFTFVMITSAALAVRPDEVLRDPVLEARARALSKDLRCLVCQNQSIDDSNAPLARDLRIIVRERLAAGDSDPQVMSYVTKRYGDFVLLKPPFKATTYALWFGPFLILLIGAFGVGMFLRHRRRDAAAETPAALTPEQSARIEQLLRDEV